MLFVPSTLLCRIDPKVVEAMVFRTRRLSTACAYMNYLPGGRTMYINYRSDRNAHYLRHNRHT